MDIPHSSSPPALQQDELGQYFSLWEQTIQAANQACANDNATKAHALYAEAQTLAQTLLAKKPWLSHGFQEPSQQQEALDASLAALVVTCHNRANLYQIERNKSCADRHYQQAHTHVKNLLTDPSLPEHLYATVSRHLLRTLAELPGESNSTASAAAQHH